MEYRRVDNSGLMVSELISGTATFAGVGDFFGTWGDTDAIVDVLDEIAAETGRTVPQIALNWLLRRPTVSSVIIGARDEAQLKENLGAVEWRLDPDQVSRLDTASSGEAPYPYFPYFRQEGFTRLNPPTYR